MDVKNRLNKKGVIIMIISLWTTILGVIIQVVGLIAAIISWIKKRQVSMNKFILGKRQQF